MNYQLEEIVLNILQNKRFVVNFLKNIKKEIKMKKRRLKIAILSIVGILVLGFVYVYFAFAWMFFVKPGNGGFNYNLKIESLAGSKTGDKGFEDGQGSNVLMNKPIRFSKYNESKLVFADINNHAIRTIGIDGVVKTLAGGPDKKGYKDGKVVDAKFDNPHGVAVRSDGVIAVAEVKNNTIRLLTPESSDDEGKIEYIVSTFAGKSGMSGMLDGKNESALFDSPHSVAWGPENELYVADIGNGRIRMIKNGITTTVAGRDKTGDLDGDLKTGTLKYPMDIAVGKNGDVWIADAGTMKIRKWNKKNGLTTPFKNTTIAMPHGIAVVDNEYVLIAEMYGHRILKFDINDGKVSTLCGTTEKGIGAGKLNKPAAVFVNNGLVFVADLGNHRIVNMKFDD